MKLFLLVLIVLLLTGCTAKTYKPVESAADYHYDRFTERWNGYIWQVDDYETGIILSVNYPDDPHYVMTDATNRYAYVHFYSGD